MPATTGVDFIVKIGNERQTITLSGGSGTDTYQLQFGGQTTAAILQNAAASAVQSALEALSTIGAGNVAVAGAAGGPYTVTFQGTLAGQDVAQLTSTGATGTLVVAIATTTPTWVTAGGQRGGRLARGSADADLTSKDSAGWDENAPTNRNWTVGGDALVIENDAAQLALERAWLNKRQVHVQVLMPSGSTWSGIGTLTDFSMDGPHDDALTAAIEIKGSGQITKV